MLKRLIARYSHWRRGRHVKARQTEQDSLRRSCLRVHIHCTSMKWGLGK